MEQKPWGELTKAEQDRSRVFNCIDLAIKAGSTRSAECDLCDAELTRGIDYTVQGNQIRFWTHTQAGLVIDPIAKTAAFSNMEEEVTSWPPVDMSQVRETGIEEDYDLIEQ